jgi:hypothetical protein
MSSPVVEALCKMPVVFKDAGDTTMAALFAVSRYRADSTVSEADLEAHLRRDPALVEAWVKYSDEQRSLPAWYLMRPREGSTEDWRVDYLTSREKPREHSFPDRFAACAFFIMRKVDELLKLTEQERS